MVCNLSIWETNAEGWKTQDHPQWHSKFEVSLRCVRGEAGGGGRGKRRREGEDMRKMVRKIKLHKSIEGKWFWWTPTTYFSFAGCAFSLVPKALLINQAGEDPLSDNRTPSYMPSVHPKLILHTAKFSSNFILLHVDISVPWETILCQKATIYRCEVYFQTLNSIPVTNTSPSAKNTVLMSFVDIWAFSVLVSVGWAVLVSRGTCEL